MARIKKPALATYKMVGYSANHPMPIHVVGLLTETERYVTIGMSLEQAKAAHEKLGEALEKAAMNGSANETDAV